MVTQMQYLANREKQIQWMYGERMKKQQLSKKGYIEGPNNLSVFNM